MSDKNHEENSSKSSEKNDDERLNFFSAKFDPVFALYSKDFKVPCSEITPYDNLTVYESKENPNKKPSVPKEKKKIKEKDSEVTESPMAGRRFLPHQMPVKKDKSSKTAKNIFTKMENTQGPLAVLRKYRDERIRIKIVNRNDRGVRGYYIAFIAAFDKHWNVALEDVTEVWTRRKKIKSPILENSAAKNKWQRKNRIKPPEITIVKSDKKSETCSRYVEQLLVRGEHIVVIYPYTE